MERQGRASDGAVRPMVAGALCMHGLYQGGGAKTFARCKGMMFDRPDMMQGLLEKVADAVVAYLNAQVAHGAQALMIFDT